MGKISVWPGFESEFYLCIRKGKTLVMDRIIQSRKSKAAGVLPGATTQTSGCVRGSRAFLCIPVLGKGWDGEGIGTAGLWLQLVGWRSRAQPSSVCVVLFSKNKQAPLNVLISLPQTC